ncbi:MAG: CoA-binding protein [Bryobacteraceae bacterium]|nr:CoA-binding protein [Bryobacteraceae bacterium]
MTPTDILRKWKTIAVVGLSPKKFRPSYGVSEYMLSQGYTIIPVNPGHSEILGQTCYRRLEDIPTPFEIVNIFRRSEEVGPIVDSAIALGARVVWMQEGIEHIDAAAKARAAGLEVVMDRCILKEHRKLC